MNFSISPGEEKKIAEWRKNHMPNCKFYRKENGFEEIYVGAIGGATTYSFTPTGLGIITKITCGCGEELDVTEYEDW